MNKIIFYFLVGSLTLISSVFFIIGTNIYFNEVSSANWPKTDAVIKSSKVNMLPGKRGITYCPEWTYSFTVGQQTFISNRTAFGIVTCHKTQKNAEKELDKHPVGSKILTIYDPNDPSKAALNMTKSTFFPFEMIFIGLLCFGSGLFIIKTVYSTNKPVEFK